MRAENGLRALPPRRPQAGVRAMMDFVVGLLTAQTRNSNVVDVILAIVDRLSKLAIYEPVPGNIDALMLADVLGDVILTKHGISLSIVSDRGLLFTSTRRQTGRWNARIR